jgi:hypothetical protein
MGAETIDRPRRPWSAGLVATLAGVTLLAACTSSANHHRSTTTGTAGRSSAPAPSATASSAGTPSIAGRLLPANAACPTATPVHLQSQGPVVVAIADGITVSGLMQAGTVPPKTGDVKIVWRVTGQGTLALRSTAPDHRPGRLAFGPELHSGSSFNAPGSEWGSGFRFPEPGCWHIYVTRGGHTVPLTIAIA